MYFLGGDRIYIKPVNSDASLDIQLKDCLGQLGRINKGKKIYKINFFAGTPLPGDYLQLQYKLRKLVTALFNSHIVVSLIAQPPLTCKILIEAFYYDQSLWHSHFFYEKHGQAILFKRGNTEVLIGNIQVCSHNHCRINAEKVFISFSGFLEKVKFPVSSIVRQWNYIENILGKDDDKQRYQEFNNVRSAFYAEHFGETGFPAATGIGTDHGGVLIEFVAIRPGTGSTLPVDNPLQVSAHSYSQRVLEGGELTGGTTPKFERARYLELFDRKLIFISGTASIRGENTVGIDDPAEQTKITLQNISRLYSPEILTHISDNNLQPKYGHARVYVKNPNHFPVIKRVFRRNFGRLPVVYLIADICREDLLVEIEGKVILE